VFVTILSDIHSSGIGLQLSILDLIGFEILSEGDHAIPFLVLLIQIVQVTTSSTSRNHGLVLKLFCHRIDLLDCFKWFFCVNLV